MPLQINIDTKEITKLTKNLRELNRSAYPVAVRQTLNDLAFEMKQKQLGPVANKLFTVRDKNFFKAFSRVTKATGMNVGGMVAQSGMLDKKAAKSFDMQERGGSYGHETIPEDQARTGESKRAKISRANYLKKGLIDRNKANKTRSPRSQFIADAYMGKKLGMFVKHGGTIFRIRQFRKKKDGSITIGLKPLYNTKEGRTVHVKPTKFIEKTAKITAQRTTKIYQRAANQRFKKFFK